MARIVVIEDDGALRTDISETLREWGHKVFQAKDGTSGVDVISISRPDLVLCDICLPMKNGFDLARQIKEGEASLAMPFIFMSSLSEYKDLLYARYCGGDDYIVKPIDYAVLKTKINHFLGKQESLALKMINWISAKPDGGGADFADRRIQTNVARPFGRRKSDMST